MLHYALCPDLEPARTTSLPHLRIFKCAHACTCTRIKIQSAMSHTVSSHMPITFGYAADSCIGPYAKMADCTNPFDISSPCAFANVDLTGIPLSLVSSTTAFAAHMHLASRVREVIRDQ